MSNFKRSRLNAEVRADAFFNDALGRGLGNMGQHQFGEQVSLGDSHRGLKYHDKIFCLPGSQSEHDLLQQGLVSRVLDRPAFELRLRIFCGVVRFLSLEWQIF